PSPVTSLSVFNVYTTGITVNWTVPSSDNYVTYYTISYTPSCPQLLSVNETVSVAPHQSTTTYSYTLIGLYSGMNYTITVRAGNVLGRSDPNSIYEDTRSSRAPTSVPNSLSLSQPNNSLTWKEVNCSERNGLITGYTVMISNSSITYNLTSTERYIILNDLVFGTKYNISVAAVNFVGRGPFSDPILVEIGIGPAQIDRFKELPNPRDNEVVQGAGRRKQPVYGHQNNTISLHCNYRSRVPANTQWLWVFLNGTQVPVDTNDSAINVTDDGMNSILTIFPFSQHFAGTYRCNASNEAGSDTGDVIIEFRSLIIEEKSWLASPWSQCIPDCHRGIRNRTVVCMTVSTRMIMDGCSPPPPSSEETCHERGPCTHWVAESWSMCSKSCGVGYQVRRVNCQATYDSNITLSDLECLTARPPVFRYCNIHNCPCSEPKFCKLIVGAELCWRLEYQRICCYTCQHTL
uniref:Uncharacterized protein n=2 Tax=Amphimedon queenslandica TaxID=400682 RepID=A0A1X7USI3_AMPQE